MTVRNWVFTALVLVAFAGFAWTVQRMVRKLLKGAPVNRDLTSWPARLGDVLLYFFMQRSVAREGLSWHHLPIFWGFLVITVGTVEILANGVCPALSYELLGSGFNAAFKLALDVTNLAVLLAVFYGYSRRIFYKPNLIPMSADAALILGMIAALCVSHFISHGFHFPVKAHGSPELASAVFGPPGDPSYMPISAAVSKLAAGMTLETAHVVADINYWLHVFIILFFLNYIPYSKHLHLLGALPNILLRRRGQRGILPKLDLEDENQWGVGRYEQFSWKTLLDSYACTECARCTNSCPAYATGKPLSPMHVILDIKDEVTARGEGLLKLRSGINPRGEEHADGVEPTESEKNTLAALSEAPPLIGGRIKDDTLWSCTTCGACEEACPVFIEHPLAIVQMRTNLALEEGRVPAGLSRMFRGMENNANPWGMGQDKRMEWAEGLDLPVMSDKGEAEYLLWLGCAGAFDPEGQKTSRALVSLLKQANVDFAVLGNEESCTGDAARRAGNEFLFQTMAESNIETLAQYKVKKILTSCPHCMHTFKNEYSQFGGNYEVVHHTQFLRDLVDAGKLSPRPSESGGSADSVTYHDPCYLGRWNSEYDAPRNLLEAATGAAPVEMERTRNKSFCCGAGGAQMWLEEEGERVNTNRTKEAIGTGAKTIATGCPFCKIMVSDGVKSLSKEDDVQVMDIAQLLAERTSSP